MTNEANLNERRAKKLKEQSLHGSEGIRTGKKTTMKRKEYMTRFRIIFMAGAITGSLIIGGLLPKVKRQIEDDAYIGKITREYRGDVIIPNSGNGYYDTMGIAKAIAEDGEENLDENIYLTYRNIGEGPTSTVIEQLFRVYLKDPKCSNLTEYVQNQGCQDIKDFTEQERQKFLNSAQIAEMQEELEKMQSTEENTKETNNSK